MSVVIELSSEIEQRLRDQAASAGQRPEDFARKLVESILAAPSLDEDLARFRNAVLASGESEEESAAFFQRLVDEVRADRTRSNR